ncbi:MAG: sigma-70 family RNA polymerase sigma factor [Deltaproteobacteria bacterium]|nr:MAG: sigma-70 family RNA polymerase sigma factor [Deltaproteobacteria bacterium]
MGIRELVKKVKDKRATTAETKVPTREAQKQLEIRDKLIEENLQYAASIASKVMQGLSSSVDYDDVMCNARLGLLEAARKFDTKLNVDFKTFAYYRIKGAIYDGLRKTGWIPRSLYARIKFEQATNEYLQYMSEKSSYTAKVAGDEASELYDTVNSLASIYVISVDAAEEGMDIEDKKARPLEESAEFQQIKQHMKEAIECLPDKERKLVKMYYFQNKTLEEAGEALGLSKSWVSRLHARSLELLFKKINMKVKGEKVIDDSSFEGIDYSMPETSMAVAK